MRPLPERTAFRSAAPPPSSLLPSSSAAGTGMSSQEALEQEVRRRQLQQFRAQRAAAKATSASARASTSANANASAAPSSSVATRSTYPATASHATTRSRPVAAADPPALRSRPTAAAARHGTFEDAASVDRCPRMRSAAAPSSSSSSSSSTLLFRTPLNRSKRVLAARSTATATATATTRPAPAASAARSRRDRDLLAAATARSAITKPSARAPAALREAAPAAAAPRPRAAILARRRREDAVRQHVLSVSRGAADGAPSLARSRPPAAPAVADPASARAPDGLDAAAAVLGPLTTPRRAWHDASAFATDLGSAFATPNGGGSRIPVMKARITPPLRAAADADADADANADADADADADAAAQDAVVAVDAGHPRASQGIEDPFGADAWDRDPAPPRDAFDTAFEPTRRPLAPSVFAPSRSTRRAREREREHADARAEERQRGADAARAHGPPQAADAPSRRREAAPPAARGGDRPAAAAAAAPATDPSPPPYGFVGHDTADLHARLRAMVQSIQEGQRRDAAIAAAAEAKRQQRAAAAAAEAAAEAATARVAAREPREPRPHRAMRRSPSPDRRPRASRDGAAPPAPAGAGISRAVPPPQSWTIPLTPKAQRQRTPPARLAARSPTARRSGAGRRPDRAHERGDALPAADPRDAAPWPSLFQPTILSHDRRHDPDDDRHDDDDDDDDRWEAHRMDAADRFAVPRATSPPAKRPPRLADRFADGRATAPTLAPAAADRDDDDDRRDSMDRRSGAPGGGGLVDDPPYSHSQDRAFMASLSDAQRLAEIEAAEAAAIDAALGEDAPVDAADVTAPADAAMMVTPPSATPPPPPPPAASRPDEAAAPPYEGPPPMTLFSLSALDAWMHFDSVTYRVPFALTRAVFAIVAQQGAGGRDPDSVASVQRAEFWMRWVALERAHIREHRLVFPRGATTRPEHVIFRRGLAHLAPGSDQAAYLTSFFRAWCEALAPRPPSAAGDRADRRAWPVPAVDLATPTRPSQQDAAAAAAAAPSVSWVWREPPPVVHSPMAPAAEPPVPTPTRSAAFSSSSSSSASSASSSPGLDATTPRSFNETIDHDGSMQSIDETMDAASFMPETPVRPRALAVSADMTPLVGQMQQLDLSRFTTPPPAVMAPSVQSSALASVAGTAAFTMATPLGAAATAAAPWTDEDEDGGETSDEAAGRSDLWAAAGPQPGARAPSPSRARPRSPTPRHAPRSAPRRTIFGGLVGLRTPTHRDEPATMPPEDAFVDVNQPVVLDSAAGTGASVASEDARRLARPAAPRSYVPAGGMARPAAAWQPPPRAPAAAAAGWKMPARPSAASARHLDLDRTAVRRDPAAAARSPFDPLSRAPRATAGPGAWSGSGSDGDSEDDARRPPRMLNIYAAPAGAPAKLAAAPASAPWAAPVAMPARRGPRPPPVRHAF